MSFDYTVKTNQTFDEAVAYIEKETSKAGFKVLHIHDVQKTVGAKGFKLQPFKIIEICNAKSAYTVLQVDPLIGLCLPCKINVYVKNNKTFISGMRPIILSQFFPDEDLGEIPEEIDKIIGDIINNAK